MTTSLHLLAGKLILPIQYMTFNNPRPEFKLIEQPNN